MKHLFAALTLDGQSASVLPLMNTAPNGFSYLHLIAAGDKPGSGMQLENVTTEVR